MLHSSFAPPLEPMERAARLLVQLKSKNIALEDLARAAWPKAVGAKLDRRTRAVGMVRSTLVVEVEDAIWQRQLNAIRGHILVNLTKLLGPGSIADLEFRIGVPRRPPQSEQTAAQPALLSADEADRIADPMFQRLYRIGRRKAAGA